METKHDGGGAGNWTTHLMSPPVWSRALTQVSVTGPSKSLDPDSGTVCRLHCVSLTRQSASSRNCWRVSRLEFCCF